MLTFAVACFYLQSRAQGKAQEDSYYRAVYLMQRTLNEFVSVTAIKFGIDPSKIVRTVRINQKGLQILMDDEAIRELPEGQDMKVEFTMTEMQQPQWHTRSPAMEMQSAFELRLVF